MIVFVRRGNANSGRSSSDAGRRRPRNRADGLYYRASRRHATLCQRAKKTDQGEQQIRQAAAIGGTGKAKAEAIPRAALAARLTSLLSATSHPCRFFAISISEISFG